MSTPELPPDVQLQRVTDEFTASTVPAGLRRAHRIATGTWGVLRVHHGGVRFVFEDEGGGDAVELAAGDRQVIPPDTPHHVEPHDDARFVIEFHR